MRLTMRSMRCLMMTRNKSYEIAFKLIKNSLGDGHDVTVDYTGGTKSMSVGLAVAAMEFPQCNLSVVKGKRQDLIRVRDGMERVSRLPSYTVFAQRQERLCRDLIREWNYTAAVQILEEMSRSGFVSNEKNLTACSYCAVALLPGINSDYQSAVEKISIYKEDPIIAGYNSTLKQICAALDWYEKMVSQQ